MPYVGNKSTTFNTFSATDVSVTDDLTVTDDASVGGDLTVTGSLTGTTATLTTADNSDQLTLKSTDADASSGPSLSLTRDSGSPADNDAGGKINFNFDDDGGNVSRTAAIFTTLVDASAGSEDGKIHIETMIAGAEGERFGIGPTEVVVNEASVDLDFRVESNNSSTAFVIDAGDDTATFTNCPVTITSADNLAQLTLKSTDADANEGPVLVLQRDSSSPADDDTAGKIYFYADNDAGEVTTFASLEVQLDDVSDGTEDAGIRLKKMYEGSLTEMVRFAGGGEFVFMAPQSFTGEQRHKFEWWNENLAGIMAKISVNREASYQAPGALTFFTSTNVDSSSNNSQGEISEKFRIASNGDLTATDTSIASNSDSRLKTSIADFTYDLDKFKAFKTKTFDWKSPSLHGNKTGQRGFLAQDLESVDAYWTDKIEVDSDSNDYQYLEDEDILWGENNSYMPEGKSATDVERVARFAKTSKLGQKDAMYISVIQQLIARIEKLEDA